MMKAAFLPTCLLGALFTVACGSAEMASSSPLVASDEAPTADSPYEVELVSNGQTLPTYAHNGRFYVLGQVGQRYGIRVKNPTPVRIEAIVSVDGLDVIDGETANSNKRGYVVMPNASITIDGFRVSSSHVAAFRFSSVDNSYAGRKGKARNVGAIGVAIFSERAAPTMVLPQQRVSSRDRWEGESNDSGDGDGDGDDDSDFSGGWGASGSAQGAPAPTRRTRVQTRPGNDKASAKRAPASVNDSVAPRSEIRRPPTDEECCSPKTNRPGLGTEYGERRYSAVGFTRFVRQGSTPTAYAELRYNNSAGLAALGVTTGPGFDDGELSRRETAEPFPGQRFSQPPR